MMVFGLITSEVSTAIGAMNNLSVVDACLINLRSQVND